MKVNGEPAQILYASPEQVNFVVPGDTPVGAARIVVENLGRAAAPIATQIVDAAPGLFTASQDGRGMIAATRVTDHSAIAEDRPAHAGDILSLQISGMGVSSPALSVSIGGTPAAILQALPASNGISVLVVRVPNGVSGEASVVVTANGRASNSATLPVE